MIKSAIKNVWNNLLGTRSNMAASYYSAIRNEAHVFIFGVCGRSSTTALQRLLNSTEQICIWGEPGDYLADRLATAICYLQAKMAEPNAAKRRKILHHAFHKRNHSVAYPMAYNDWLPVAEKVADAFSEMLRPPIAINRFGFKEIRVQDRNTLQALQTIFPKAHIAYLFRDPRTQWPSVQTMNWQHASDLQSFLDEYARLALIYIEHGGVFCENESLKIPDKMNRIADCLGLQGVDKKLIDDGVFSKVSKPPLSRAEEQAIMDSDAFQLYLRMKVLELDIFKGIPTTDVAGNDSHR